MMKPFEIPKEVVWEACLQVRAKKGSAGVDGKSIEDFERDLKKNLYRIWNRMSSGTYFPPPALQVVIPKHDGGRGSWVFQPFRTGSPRWSSRCTSILSSIGTPTDIGQVDRHTMPSPRRENAVGNSTGFLISTSDHSLTPLIMIW